jgi:hypothetical protein
MRRFLIALAAGLGLAAVLIGALPWLAEPVLRAGLRLAAPGEVDFDRLRFGWGDLALEGVALGEEGQEARRLRIVYRLPGLLDGGLARVEIDGLVLHGAWRHGRLHLAGLEIDDATGEADAELPLPDIEQAVLQDARLELSTGVGTLLVPFSAQVQARGERLASAVTLADARLAGIEGTIAASGAVEGDVPRAAPLALDKPGSRATSP